MPAAGTQAVTMVLGLVAAVVSIVVHECGHLAAGLAAGFRFELFVLGPLRLHRDAHNRVRVGWNRDLSMLGGAAAALPVRTEGLRGAAVRYAAGGPLASLLLAAAAAAIIPHVPQLHHAPVVALKWLVLISASVGIVNLIPLPTPPFVSDGLRILRILDRGAHGDRETALFGITALQTRGVRARDWDEGLLTRALAVRDGSMFECQCLLWSYRRTLDIGHVAVAGEVLDRAISLAPRTPAMLRHACLVELAYFEAAHRRRPAVAREALASVPIRTTDVTAADRLRAEAALAAAEGRLAEAASTVEAALAALPATAVTERAWLESMRDDLMSVPH